MDASVIALSKSDVTIWNRLLGPLESCIDMELSIQDSKGPKSCLAK